jgi:hypothetical protein
MADRTATVTWHGNLPDGQGTINSRSGALSNLPVSNALRGNVSISVQATLD